MGNEEWEGETTKNCKKCCRGTWKNKVKKSDRRHSITRCDTNSALCGKLKNALKYSINELGSSFTPSAVVIQEAQDFVVSRYTKNDFFF